MQRSFNRLVLNVFCISLTTATYALAGHGGGHSGSGGPPASGNKTANHSFTSKLGQQTNQKVLTGTRNGVGCIADPAHNLSPKGPKTGLLDGNSNIATLGTNLTAITPPIVRDHGDKPTVTTNPYSNPPTVTGDSGVTVHFIFPGGFTAPYQHPPVVDHRTPTGRNGGHSQQEPFTPDTQGPANAR